MFKHLLARTLRPLFKGYNILRGDPTYEKANLGTEEIESLPINIVKKVCNDCDQTEQELMCFHIRKHLYVARYRYRFMDTYYILYEIYGEMPIGMDKEIREIYVQSIMVPRLLAWVFTDTEQLNAVISFFLDLNIDKTLEIIKEKETRENKIKVDY